MLAADPPFGMARHGVVEDVQRGGLLSIGPVGEGEGIVFVAGDGRLPLGHRFPLAGGLGIVAEIQQRPAVAPAEVGGVGGEADGLVEIAAAGLGVALHGEEEAPPMERVDVGGVFVQRAAVTLDAGEGGGQGGRGGGRRPVRALELVLLPPFGVGGSARRGRCGLAGQIQLVAGNVVGPEDQHLDAALRARAEQPLAAAPARRMLDNRGAVGVQDLKTVPRQLNQRVAVVAGGQGANGARAGRGIFLAAPQDFSGGGQADGLRADAAHAGAVRGPAQDLVEGSVADQNAAGAVLQEDEFKVMVFGGVVGWVCLVGQRDGVEPDAVAGAVHMGGVVGDKNEMAQRNLPLGASVAHENRPAGGGLFPFQPEKPRVGFGGRSAADRAAAAGRAGAAAEGAQEIERGGRCPAGRSRREGFPVAAGRPGQRFDGEALNEGEVGGTGLDVAAEDEDMVSQAGGGGMAGGLVADLNLPPRLRVEVIDDGSVQLVVVAEEIERVVHDDALEGAGLDGQVGQGAPGVRFRVIDLEIRHAKDAVESPGGVEEVIAGKYVSFARDGQVRAAAPRLGFEVEDLDGGSTPAGGFGAADEVEAVAEDGRAGAADGDGQVGQAADIARFRIECFEDGAGGRHGRAAPVEAQSAGNIDLSAPGDSDMIAAGSYRPWEDVCGLGVCFQAFDGADQAAVGMPAEDIDSAARFNGGHAETFGLEAEGRVVGLERRRGGGRGPGRCGGSTGHAFQGGFQGHGVADPGDPAFPDDERGRDAPAPGGLHPAFRHEAVVGVEGDGVVHLIAHVLDKARDLGGNIVPALPDVHADERHIGEAAGQFGQMGDRGSAGRAPGRPEFDHVDLIRGQGLDGAALDPFGHL